MELDMPTRRPRLSWSGKCPFRPFHGASVPDIRIKLRNFAHNGVLINDCVLEALHDACASWWGKYSFNAQCSFDSSKVLLSRVLLSLACQLHRRESSGTLDQSKLKESLIIPIRGGLVKRQACQCWNTSCSNLLKRATGTETDYAIVCWRLGTMKKSHFFTPSDMAKVMDLWGNACWGVT